jgi:hypothetical protein
MSLRRLRPTRLAGSGRITTDMLEAARIIICWHFCWHSRVEDFQTLQFQLFKFGGEGRNRSFSPSSGVPADLFKELPL